MANTSLAGTTRVAAAITCARSVLPPTSCSTFGSCDLSRVPLPAAMMATATLGAKSVEVFEGVGFVDFFIRPTIPWGGGSTKERLAHKASSCARTTAGGGCPHMKPFRELAQRHD